MYLFWFFINANNGFFRPGCLRLFPRESTSRDEHFKDPKEQGIGAWISPDLE